MEHISPQSIMGHSSVSPDPMFPMEDYLCPPHHTLSVTKPVKKRKSWGQELPEPKTHLPPRKRAKTEDEKEQRRIERIKRNRAAAHNSRERKRVEAEHLANANGALQNQLKALRQLCAEQGAQLAKCKEQLGELPEVTQEETNAYDQRRYSEHSMASSSQSRCSSSTIDPRASLSCSTPATSPEESPYIKMEDNMPEPIHHGDALFPSLDQIQHSAAMLCDLQCRSGEADSSQPLPQSTPPTWVWAPVILFLMHTSVTNFYKSTLLALWTHSPAQMNRLMSTSTTGSTSTTRPQTSTSPSQTPRPSWSTLAQLIMLATGPSTLGSSADALSSGSRKSGWSIASRSLRSSLDRSGHGRDSFEGQGIEHREKVNHHDHGRNDNQNGTKSVTDRKCSIGCTFQGAMADKDPALPPE